MAEKTPGDVRKAEFLRDRLNAPGEKIFVPDRSGPAVVRKHPVVVLRLRPSLQGQQPFDAGLGQPDGAIGTVVLRRVELAAVGERRKLEYQAFVAKSDRPGAASERSKDLGKK
jgi:hypothetical protein